MSNLFISHSSKDKNESDKLSIHLRKNGYESFFLDHDSKRGIIAGQNWEQALYRNLRVCEAVINICSDNYLQSQWCFAETAIARMLGKQIFTLLINPLRSRDKLPSILTDCQCTDLRNGTSEGYNALIRGLEGLSIVPLVHRKWNENYPLYPGFQSFDVNDFDVFFGRDVEIRQGIELVEMVRRQGYPRVILVLGASGSGKSSLVRAGLLPRFRQDTRQWRVVGPILPDQEPIEELAACLSSTFTCETENFDQILSRLETSGDLVREIRRLRRSEEQKLKQAKTLIVVDQFEELLGHDDPKHAANRFLRLLKTSTVDQNGPLILATLRSDFLGIFQQSEALRGVEFKSLSMPPMTEQGMRAVIEKPAELAGITLEDGLTDLLVKDAGGPDALPLLAFTLRTMWDRYRYDKCLKIGEYRELEGLEGVVVREADAVLERALQLGSEQDLRKALLQMVRTTEDGTGFARQSITFESLPEKVQPMINYFVDRRLLVSRGEANSRIVKVAHEALFRSWPKLRDWFEESRAERYQLTRLRRASVDWVESGRLSSFLWSNERVVEMSQIIESLNSDLSEFEREFLGPIDPEEMLSLLLDTEIDHSLRATIGTRLALLGDDREGVGVDHRGVPEIAWCPISEGKIGSFLSDRINSYPKVKSLANRLPEGHKIEYLEISPRPKNNEDIFWVIVQSFYIARYPVTWCQYKAFVDAEDYGDERWWSDLERPVKPLNRPSQFQDNEPVTSLTWYEAMAFCRWLSARLNIQVRLPSIWEWELSASGGDRERKYSWGTHWEPMRANTIESGLGCATAVGMYPAGASATGVIELNGNVFEWCLGKAGTGEVPLAGDSADRAIRGGSWNHVRNNAETFFLNSDPPKSRYFDLGFRLVKE